MRGKSRGVECHEHIGLVPMRVDRAGADIEGKCGHARRRAGRRPDLCRKIGKRSEVVPEIGRRLGEQGARRLDAVAGVARKSYADEVHARLPGQVRQARVLGGMNHPACSGGVEEIASYC